MKKLIIGLLIMALICVAGLGYICLYLLSEAVSAMNKLRTTPARQAKSETQVAEMSAKIAELELRLQEAAESINKTKIDSNEKKS